MVEHKLSDVETVYASNIMLATLIACGGNVDKAREQIKSIRALYEDVAKELFPSNPSLADGLDLG